MTAEEIRTDNTKTLMNALKRIDELEKENAELKGRHGEIGEAFASPSSGDDFERARLYLIEKYGLRKDIEFEKIQHSVLSIEYSTYLAGLKAGEKLGFEKGVKAKVNTTTISDCPIKPVWHKVADGDYPPCEKGNYTISVLTDKGDIAYYSYNYDCWIAEPSSGEIDPPIAWCEIPKYTKE